MRPARPINWPAASSIATPSTRPTATATARWKTCGATRRTPPTWTGWATPTTTTAMATQYAWWTIQKTTDIYHNPPWFIAPFTYERSVRYPNGHRNVIFAQRGIRTLPRGDMQGDEKTGTPDTKMLYAYLKHFGGICASHTSATGMGTDWRDNDPLVEPIVEIYQGDRNNYECEERPRGLSPAAKWPTSGQEANETSIPRVSSGTPWPRATASASKVPATTSAPTPAMASPLVEKPGREALVGGLPRPPLLRRHRQHPAGRAVRRPPDGRGIHFRRQADAGDPRRGNGPHRQARHRPQSTNTCTARRRTRRRWTCSGPTPIRRRPAPATTTSASSRPTPTWPGVRRCGSLTSPNVSKRTQAFAEAVTLASGDMEFTPYSVPVPRWKHRRHVPSPAGRPLHAR